MTPDGSRLVAIGNFRTVSGQRRVQVAMIDTSGAQAALTDWSTTRFSMACSQNFPTYTLGIDISPDGKYFVVGTGGAFNGGAAPARCATRSPAGRSTGPGPDQQPTWVDYMGGDTTTAIDITGAAVYIGGHFRWANNPYAADAGARARWGARGWRRSTRATACRCASTPASCRCDWGVNRFDSTARASGSATTVTPWVTSRPGGSA